jgi:thioredoxin reductase (NADPH)
MLTHDQLKSVSLFSSLGPEQIDDLIKVAADINVGPGDYVVNEGDEAALFAVLQGHIEITKLIDGIERKLGDRSQGVLFGEVPLIFGTRFQSNARAAQRSRVLKIDAANYYKLAAAAPTVAQTLNSLANERIGGLRSIAAQTRPAAVTLVGHKKDPACLVLRRFFDRVEMRFDWLTPDENDLAQRWHGDTLRPDGFPTVHCEDGTTLFRPSIREIAARMGLHTSPQLPEYDTVIVGGGPAGLAAAVYGASEGLRTLVIEREAPGGQAGTSSRIENYLGFPSGISGAELASRAHRQAVRLGAEIILASGIREIDADRRTIKLESGEEVMAKTVILATGVSWRRVPIDGVDRLIGKGVYYGTSRTDAGIAQGQDVHLIGAGNSAGQAAMNMANHARTVTLLVRGDSLEKSMSRYLIDQIAGKQNIIVALNSEIRAVHGQDHIAAVDILNRQTGESTTSDSGGIFVFIGADAETDWLPDAIARDAKGYILTGIDLIKAGRWDHDRDPYLLETSVPGIFACGDVRLSPVKRVAAAVGEGSMAIAFVHQCLQLNSLAPNRTK